MNTRCELPLVRCPAPGEIDVGQLAAARLRESPYLPLRRVSCSFGEGVLTLRGQVCTYYLKQLAQTLVRAIAGVGEVDNQLDVVTPGSRSSTARRAAS